MTTQHMVRFFRQRPFEPFTMVLVDGRDIHVQHPDFAHLGVHAGFVVYHHPSGQIEIIDTSLIVSIRTIYPADIVDYAGSTDEQE